MANYKSTDTVMHGKTSDKEDIIVLPVTRYKNVLNAPNVVTDISSTKNAPFSVLVSGTDTIDSTELNNLLGSEIF